MDAVTDLPLKLDNYKEAVAILKERFGNTQMLLSAHMNLLIKMQKVKNKEDVKGLRKLHSDIESCVRNLKRLKLDTTAYGSLLMNCLFSFRRTLGVICGT